VTQPAPASRHTVDSLTDDELQQLYDDLAWAREQTLAAQQEATEAVTRAEAAEQRAERAEAALNAVRALHASVQYGKQTICGRCSGYADGSCDNGSHLYPCATVQALDAHTNPKGSAT
jgi:hypothetical protein